MSGALLAAALAYARAGFSVFPAGAGEKRKAPFTPNGFKDATTDEADIQVWWARWPGASIAIPTGDATGLVVLDVDPRHGGDATLASLVAEYAPLPECPHALTGGGGDHYFFLHPGGGVPVAHGFRPGLDLQADGAYVIVPPSSHASGGTYRWGAPLIGGPRLPLLPPWLLKLAVEPHAPRGVAVPLPPAGLDDDGLLARLFAGPNGALHRHVYERHLAIEHSKDHAAYVSFCTALLFAGASEDQVPRVLRFTPESWEKSGRYQWRHLYGKGGYYRKRETLIRASPLYREAAESLATDSARPDADAVSEHGSPISPPGPHTEGGPAETRAEPPPIPDGLFTETKTGQLVPVLPEFLAWFRRGDRFVVPVERGTFSSPGAFELLRYEGGYYNGMARAHVRGRVEDAFRRVGAAARDAFREEVVKGIAATSEFHRRRDRFNPPDLLCLANGILDTRAGAFSPHTPDVVFTWRLPVPYDPAAACPAFEAFLEWVQPDPARRALVVDLMGYCLWRRNPFQTFFVNVGDGANGKTTWMRVMEELLGQDAVAAESLQNLSAQRFAPAELEGKLANLCDDLPYDRPLAATGVLKILSGEGEFTGERKFLPKFKFRFEGKLIANANRTPEVRDDTYAFWRRLVAIPWEVTVPEEQRDPALIDKLRAELPGILNLALRGLARCRARAEFDPDGVFAGSREEWRARADVVRAELLEDYQPDAHGFVSNSDLYSWHARRSEQAGREPLNPRAFGRKVGMAFPLSHSEQHGHVWGRPGISRRTPRPDIDEAGAASAQRRLDEATTDPKTGGFPGGVDLPQPGGDLRPEKPDGPHLRPDQLTGGPEGSAPPPVFPGSGAPLHLLPEPQESSSQVDDKPRHGNCPTCVSIPSHVCYSCRACSWAENHLDDTPI